LESANHYYPINDTPSPAPELSVTVTARDNFTPRGETAKQFTLNIRDINQVPSDFALNDGQPSNDDFYTIDRSLDVDRDGIDDIPPAPNIGDPIATGGNHTTEKSYTDGVLVCKAVGSLDADNTDPNDPNADPVRYQFRFVSPAPGDTSYPLSPIDSEDSFDTSWQGSYTTNFNYVGSGLTNGFYMNTSAKPVDLAINPCQGLSACVLLDCEAYQNCSKGSKAYCEVRAFDPHGAATSITRSEVIEVVGKQPGIIHIDGDVPPYIVDHDPDFDEALNNALKFYAVDADEEDRSGLSYMVEIDVVNSGDWLVLSNLGPAPGTGVRDSDGTLIAETPRPINDSIESEISARLDPFSLDIQGVLLGDAERTDYKFLEVNWDNLPYDVARHGINGTITERDTIRLRFIVQNRDLQSDQETVTLHVRDLNREPYFENMGSSVNYNRVYFTGTDRSVPNTIPLADTGNLIIYEDERIELQEPVKDDDPYDGEAVFSETILTGNLAIAGFNPSTGTIGPADRGLMQILAFTPNYTYVAQPALEKDAVSTMALDDRLLGTQLPDTFKTKTVTVKIKDINRTPKFTRLDKTVPSPVQNNVTISTIKVGDSNQSPGTDLVSVSAVNRADATAVKLTVKEFQVISFKVTASDADAAPSTLAFSIEVSSTFVTPERTVGNPEPPYTFTDNGDGTAVFTWQPNNKLVQHLDGGIGVQKVDFEGGIVPSTVTVNDGRSADNSAVPLRIDIKASDDNKVPVVPASVALTAVHDYITKNLATGQPSPEQDAYNPETAQAEILGAGEAYADSVFTCFANGSTDTDNDLSPDGTLADDVFYHYRFYNENSAPIFDTGFIGTYDDIVEGNTRGVAWLKYAGEYYTDRVGVPRNTLGFDVHGRSRGAELDCALHNGCARGIKMRCEARAIDQYMDSTAIASAPKKQSSGAFDILNKPPSPADQPAWTHSSKSTTDIYNCSSGTNAIDIDVGDQAALRYEYQFSYQNFDIDYTTPPAVFDYTSHAHKEKTYLHTPSEQILQQVTADLQAAQRGLTLSENAVVMAKYEWAHGGADEVAAKSADRSALEANFEAKKSAFSAAFQELRNQTAQPNPMWRKNTFIAQGRISSGNQLDCANPTNRAEPESAANGGNADCNKHQQIFCRARAIDSQGSASVMHIKSAPITVLNTLPTIEEKNPIGFIAYDSGADLYTLKEATDFQVDVKANDSDEDPISFATGDFPDFPPNESFSYEILSATDTEVIARLHWQPSYKFVVHPDILSKMYVFPFGAIERDYEPDVFPLYSGVTFSFNIQVDDTNRKPVLDISSNPVLVDETSTYASPGIQVIDPDTEDIPEIVVVLLNPLLITKDENALDLNPPYARKDEFDTDHNQLFDAPNVYYHGYLYGLPVGVLGNQSVKLSAGASATPLQLRAYGNPLLEDNLSETVPTTPFSFALKWDIPTSALIHNFPNPVPVSVVTSRTPLYTAVGINPSNAIHLLYRKYTFSLHARDRASFCDREPLLDSAWYDACLISMATAPPVRDKVLARALVSDPVNTNLLVQDKNQNPVVVPSDLYKVDAADDVTPGDSVNPPYDFNEDGRTLVLQLNADDTDFEDLIEYITNLNVNDPNAARRTTQTISNLKPSGNKLYYITQTEGDKLFDTGLSFQTSSGGRHGYIDWSLAATLVNHNKFAAIGDQHHYPSEPGTFQFEIKIKAQDDWNPDGQGTYRGRAVTALSTPIHIIDFNQVPAFPGVSSMSFADVPPSGEVTPGTNSLYSCQIITLASDPDNSAPGETGADTITSQFAFLQTSSAGLSSRNTDGGGITPSAPIVLVQAQTANEADAIVTRIQNINAEDGTFEIRVQEQKSGGITPAESPLHMGEAVGYVLVRRGIGMLSQVPYEAGTLQTDHNYKQLNFVNASAYSRPPTALFSLQTYTGSDTAGVRLQNASTSSIQAKIEEENSDSSGVTHPSETIGYFAVGMGNSGFAYKNGTVSIFETKRVQNTVDHNFTRVTFMQAYASAPIVIANIMPTGAAQPSYAHTRIKNVTTTGFDVKIEEWDYEADKSHLKEDISYVAVLPGIWGLPGGLLLEAETALNITNAFSEVSFSSVTTIDVESTAQWFNPFVPSEIPAGISCDVSVPSQPLCNYDCGAVQTCNKADMLLCFARGVDSHNGVGGFKTGMLAVKNRPPIVFPSDKISFLAYNGGTVDINTADGSAVKASQTVEITAGQTGEKHAYSDDKITCVVNANITDDPDTAELGGTLNYRVSMSIDGNEIQAGTIPVVFTNTLTTHSQVISQSIDCRTQPLCVKNKNVVCSVSITDEEGATTLGESTAFPVYNSAPFVKIIRDGDASHTVVPGVPESIPEGDTIAFNVWSVDDDSDSITYGAFYDTVDVNIATDQDADPGDYPSTDPANWFGMSFQEVVVPPAHYDFKWNTVPNYVVDHVHHGDSRDMPIDFIVDDSAPLKDIGRSVTTITVHVVDVDALPLCPHEHGQNDTQIRYMGFESNAFYDDFPLETRPKGFEAMPSAQEYVLRVPTDKPIYLDSVFKWEEVFDPDIEDELHQYGAHLSTTSGSPSVIAELNDCPVISPGTPPYSCDPARIDIDELPSAEFLYPNEDYKLTLSAQSVLGPFQTFTPAEKTCIYNFHTEPSSLAVLSVDDTRDIISKKVTDTAYDYKIGYTMNNNAPRFFAINFSFVNSNYNAQLDPAPGAQISFKPSEFSAAWALNPTSVSAGDTINGAFSFRQKASMQISKNGVFTLGSFVPEAFSGLISAKGSLRDDYYHLVYPQDTDGVYEFTTIVNQTSIKQYEVVGTIYDASTQKVRSGDVVRGFEDTRSSGTKERSSVDLGRANISENASILGRIDLESLGIDSKSGAWRKSAKVRGGKTPLGYPFIEMPAGNCTPESMFGSAPVADSTRMPILNGNVYFCSGDFVVPYGEMLMFMNAPTNNRGNGTIVIGGDFHIQDDIKYDTNMSAVTSVRQLASVGWIVKGSVFLSAVEVNNDNVQNGAGVCIHPPGIRADATGWCDIYDPRVYTPDPSSPGAVRVAVRGGNAFLAPIHVVGSFFMVGDFHTGFANIPLKLYGLVVANSIQLERLEIVSDVKVN